MKAILMSIQPQWCEKIASGEKTVEVRKTVPKLKTPFKVYMYCTEKGKYLYRCRVDKNRLAVPERWNGKVIGEFVCDWVKEITPHCDINGCINQYIHKYPAILGDDCLSFEQMKAYLGNKKGFDWHISDVKIYDKPKELCEFKPWCEKYIISYDPLEVCCDCKKAFYDEDGAWFGCGLARPPQSWCYVEELK